jgi:hypothetical protein
MADWKEESIQKGRRFMRKAAAPELLQNRIGQLFDAIVTGASDNLFKADDSPGIGTDLLG